MNYNTYLEDVSKRFSKSNDIQINPLFVRSYYEEVFKLKWIATKLKILSSRYSVFMLILIIMNDR